MSEGTEIQTSGGNGAAVPATTKATATIQAYLRGAGFIQEIRKLVGDDASIAQRFARVALTQVMTPDRDGKLGLLSCTVESLCQCLYQIAGAGLEPGRDAYLIPRGGRATVIIRWEGYVRAARASGEVRRIWAQVIRKGDKYAIRAGSQSPGIDHSYDLESERGDIIGAYACAEWADGTVETEVLTREYLDRCRAAGQAGGNASPWVRWHDRMCLKTAIKRLCERLPLGGDASDALAKVAAIDPDSEAEDGAGMVVAQPPEPTNTEKIRASLAAKTALPPAAPTAPAATDPTIPPATPRRQSRAQSPKPVEQPAEAPAPVLTTDETLDAIKAAAGELGYDSGKLARAASGVLGITCAIPDAAPGKLAALLAWLRDKPKAEAYLSALFDREAQS